MIRLGSNSPTRAKILEAFNIEFIQNGGNFDEDSINPDYAIGKFQSKQTYYKI